MAFYARTAALSPTAYKRACEQRVQQNIRTNSLSRMIVFFVGAIFGYVILSAD